MKAFTVTTSPDGTGVELFASDDPDAVEGWLNANRCRFALPLYVFCAE